MIPTRVWQYEWQQLRRLRFLPPLLTAFGVCCLLAIINGRVQVGHREQQARDLLADEQVRYGRLARDLDDYAAGRKRVVGFIDPSSAGLIGRTSGARVVVQPTGSLATLALGQLDLYPGYYRVTTDNLDVLLAPDELDNPERLAVGRFDLAFVLVFLYPVVILALSYDVVAADREAGRLALVMVSAERPWVLVLARILLRAGLLIGVSVLVSLIGAGLSSSFSLSRLVWWCIALLVYTFVWLGLALLINTLRLNASASAMTLATVWVALVLVIPQTLRLGAAYLSPTASRVQILEAVRVATQEAVQQGSSLLLRFLDDHPTLGADLDPSDYLTRSTAVQAEVDRIMSPALRRYQQQLNAQQALIDRWNWLSPAILLQDVLEELAGTGPASIKDFEGQVRSFHERWSAFFLPKTLARERLTAQDLETFPRLRYQPRFPSGVWMPLLLLGVFASSIWAIGCWRLQSL